MTLARDIRLRLTALAQEFQDDGQNFCASDIRAALAEVEQLELTQSNVHQMRQMTDERLKQLRKDALGVMRTRRQALLRMSPDLLKVFADPTLSIDQAAIQLSLTKGKLAGLVKRAGGIVAVRARYAGSVGGPGGAALGAGAGDGR